MYFTKRDIKKIVLTLLWMYFIVLIMSYTDTVSWGLWKEFFSYWHALYSDI